MIKGDIKGKYQAKLKVRGGAIVPVGKVIENVNENSFDPLTLVVCPDKDGMAEGALYWDKGDGWEFQKGDYKKFSFKAELKDGRNVIVSMLDSEGNGQVELGEVKVKVLYKETVHRGASSLEKGITIRL